MLLRFSVANHRSILDPVELSLIAVDEDRPATRAFDRLSQRVLPVAGIFGPNASGKSNVLDAVAWLATAVGTSLRWWTDTIPRDPHRFAGGPGMPTEFDLDLMAEGVRYNYQLELDDTAVLSESLYSYPEGRPRQIFTREGEECKFRRGVQSVGGIQDLLTPTTLVLSAAMRLAEPTIAPPARKLTEMSAIWRQPKGRTVPFLSNALSPLALTGQSTIRLFEELQGAPEGLPFVVDGIRPQPVELLRLADPSISNVKVSSSSDPEERMRQLELFFVRKDGPDDAQLNFLEESLGTQRWFQTIGPVVDALEGGKTMLIDELDASLHPRLSSRVVELFQDPATNPNNAQLIFTSHDMHLLSQLNRDEIWLTEKSRDLKTKLVGLAEYKGERVRKSLNLERAYLQGRFGAVPDIDHYDVSRALGLV